MAFSFAAVHLSAIAVPAVSAKETATVNPSANRWVGEWSMERVSSSCSPDNPPSEDRGALPLWQPTRQLKICISEPGS